MSFVCKKLNIKHGSKSLVDIDFTCSDSLAIVGQSGSGKSLTLKAILGLLQSSLHVEFDYEADFKLVCGSSVSFVPQNPFTALSSMSKIKDQIFCDDVGEIFKLLDLDESFLQRFPSELSGGQLQRIVIAIALLNRPKLLLMDEPTTALDRANTQMVLDMLKSLQCRYNFLLLYVTHDIDSVSELCSDIAVLKHGKVVERGRMSEVLGSPKNDYTKELLEASFKHRGFRQ